MNNSTQELLRYLKLIYKRRYLFIGVTVLVMTLMIAWSYTRPKLYKAESTVFIETNVINSLVQGIAVTPDMDERIHVLSYALLSRGLLERVLEKMGLPIVSKEPNKIEAFINGLISRIKIEVRRNELFIVSIVDSDPHFAQDFINMLVSTYVEESLSGTRAETYGAKRFLDEQIDHFRDKLEQTENAIIDFRKKQGVYVTINEEAIIDDLRQYQRELESIEISLATLTAQRDQHQRQLKTLPATLPLFNEQEQGDRILALETRLRQLLLTFTDGYPEVVRLKAEIEGLKRGRRNGEPSKAPSTGEMNIVNPVYQDVQQIIFDLEGQISSLQSRKQQLSKILTKREQILQEVPETQKNLALLVQDRDSSRRIYEELLLRHSQSEVSKQMEIGDKASTFRIVDAAFLPKIPISPNMLRQLLLSIAVGFAAGFGAVVLLENSSNKFRSLEQLQRYDIAILATIPTISNPDQVEQVKRLDMVIYFATSLYFAGILGALLLETYKRFF
jgi:polysaccharide chain length determinant protein (PEP-CTERM system associated)